VRGAALAEIKEDYRRNDIQAGDENTRRPDPTEFANPKMDLATRCCKSSLHCRTREKEFDDVMSHAGRGVSTGRMRERKSRRRKNSPKSSAEEASQPTESLTAPLFQKQARSATLKAEDFRHPAGSPSPKRSTTFSDESLSEYLAYTQLMIRLLNRLDLYKDYRAR